MSQERTLLTRFADGAQDRIGTRPTLTSQEAKPCGEDGSMLASEFPVTIPCPMSHD